MSSSDHCTLKTLRRQHHSLHPPYKLHLPSPSHLARPDSQAYLIDHILYDPVIRNVQPERSYRRAFWRKIVNTLETGVRELNEEDPENVEVPIIYIGDLDLMGDVVGV